MEAKGVTRARYKRAIKARLRAVEAALDYGTKGQIMWNVRNLQSIVKEYLK